jgi:hypothetical protein
MKNLLRKPLPVGFPVYHAISRLNRTFENCIEALEQLIGVKIVSPEKLRAYQVMLEEIRAAVNQDHAEVINEREIHNNAYYERLRLKWQERYEDPTDIPEVQTTKKQPKKKITERKDRRTRGKRKVVRP